MKFLKMGLIITCSILTQFSYSSDINTNNENSIDIKRNSSTGNTSFLKGMNNKALTIENLQFQSLDRAVINQFSGKFGINGASQELRTIKQITKPDNSTNIRYQQYYKNIPIIGAQLVANINNRQQLNSISGETSLGLNLDTQALFTSIDANRIALNYVSNLYTTSTDNLIATTPELSIYDSKLIGPTQYPAVLVWRIEVTSNKNKPIREFILVDANKGVIHLSFNQIDSLLNRIIYDANRAELSRANLPGSKICFENETCPPNNLDANKAKLYSGYTYDFYFNENKRDSFDGNGAAIISTVNYGVNYKNAFWNGEQMVYGKGYSQGLDVVAHELTHAVTQNTSNLFYQYQSGAINESFSDVWAELIDQTYNKPTQKWLIGDELSNLGFLSRPIRSMSNPEAAPYNDPASMTSQKFYSGIKDNGGVHINSGVNNKAAFLMTDGGTINGTQYTGLGISKVAKLYYEVQTNFLSSGSNYQDLYYSLNQACSELSAKQNSGLVSADCALVKAATDAVAMNMEPTTAIKAKQAQICTTGLSPSNLYFDDFEQGITKWNLPNKFDYNKKSVSPWSILATQTTLLNNVLWGVAYGGLHDFQATMNNNIQIPSTGSTYLHFKHKYSFETYIPRGSNTTYRLSGGVIEYSIDNGISWKDGGSLITSGLTYDPVSRVTTTPGSRRSNPLLNRSAFLEQRGSLNSTRLNLTSLAGRNVRFRWRVGTNGNGSTGWFIDDIRIYQCVTTPVNRNPIIRGITNKKVTEGNMVTLDASQSSDPDNQPLTFSWLQVAGTNVQNLVNSSTAKVSFVIPVSNNNIMFKLTVSDNNGGQVTKTVTLSINKKPIANAGQDKNVITGDNVVITGTGQDVETLAENLIYTWTQLSGTNVSLINLNTSTVSFSAPNQEDSIKLQLKVDDVDGGSSTDTLTVVVARLSKPITGNVTQNDNIKTGGCVLVKSSAFDPILILLSILFLILAFRKGYFIHK